MRRSRSDCCCGRGLPRRGSPLHARSRRAFCLVELLTSFVIILLLFGAGRLALGACLDSPRARLASARRESEMLLSWLQSVTGRALRERRPFRLHLPSSEGIDYLILRWDDTGQTERYDSRGRLLMRHQLSPGTGPTQTESVFSPLFNTFSPAFSLYLLSPAAPSFSRPFRLLVVSVQGRIRLDEVPSGGR